MPVTNILRAGLELAIVFPATVLCLLPVQDRLRLRRRETALWGGLLLLLWAGLGSVVLGVMGWGGNVWLLPSLPVFFVIYCRHVELSPWKTASVALGVCGAFSCLINLAVAIETRFFPSPGGPWFSLPAGLIHNLLCWAMTAAVWYSAAHAARELLNEREMPGTWYYFWVMPVAVMGINLYIHSVGVSRFLAGGLLFFYALAGVALLALLLFTYGIFYRMAREIIANTRLQRENDFLQYQVSRYEAIKRSIEDSRRAHHDLRQHLRVVQDCVAAGDLAALADYLEKYQKTLPAEQARSYCGNYAVDAVLRYYAEQAEAMGVETEVSFQTGPRTVIPEPELCVLLGNLLENALESCAKAGGRRVIRVVARQTGGSMLSLTVDNTSATPPVVEDGRLRSTKREGFGAGTESVRIIAERYHGDARFQWRGGMFYASVLLNP